MPGKLSPGEELQAEKERRWSPRHLQMSCSALFSQSGGKDERWSKTYMQAWKK
jgi:hypothetical protein